MSWLPVGLEMPPGHCRSPEGVCPAPAAAQPVRQHRRRVGQGAGTGNCPRMSPPGESEPFLTPAIQPRNKHAKGTAQNLPCGTH